MGKGGSTTVGYWYRIAYHMGLGIGPIDAFLEFRGGDKTAWSGNLMAGGTLSINKPDLWGGESDQGGIVGDVDVLFGDAAQTPNTYLLSTFGDQVPAWRGVASIVFKGGRYGALNPYPQAASYKIRRIVEGWDNDTCWYPEKAIVALGDSTSGLGTQLVSDTAIDATSAGIDPVVNGVLLNSGFSPTDTLLVTHEPGMAYQAWSRWDSDADTPGGRQPWTNQFWVQADGAPAVAYWPEEYATKEAAEAGAANQVVYLTGASSYLIGLTDNKITDNRGGLSLRVYKNAIVSGRLGMNPAHILYYARTNSMICRVPIEQMNDASFRAAADWYYSQGFGLCTQYDPSQETPEQFEQRIEKVAAASVNRSSVDGQYYIDVANGVYDIDTLQVLTDDDVLDFSEQPTLLDGAVNSMSVKYFDPSTKESVMTAPIQALGLIDAFGTISQTNEYPEIPIATLAMRVGERDLRAGVTPLRTFNLKTTRKTNDWRPNQYKRLQLPKRGIADMVVLVGDKQGGTLKSGAITLVLTQDVYSLPATTFVDAESRVDPRASQTPVPITQQSAFEAPYTHVVATMSRADFAALPAGTAFLMTTAADPATSRNYGVAVAPDGVTYAGVANGDWCPMGAAAAPYGYMDTVIALSNASRLNEVVVGSAARWDNEEVRVDAIDLAGSTVTLGRGCGDSVRAQHAAGSVLWFYDDNAAADTTEYTVAETISVKLLTATATQQLPVASATALPVTFVGRLQLPYPPGLLKIAGQDYPAEVGGVFNVTWAERNRDAQANQLIDASMGSVAPAVNTRYGMRFTALDGGTNPVLVQRTDIGGNTAAIALAYTGNVLLELWTIDDAGASAQKHSYTFAFTPDPATTANTITAPTYTRVDTTPIIDGGIVS